MNGVIYTPLIDSMKWSYSRIKSFDTCAYAWYLKYICGDEEEDNFYASYGSFVHKLIEKYYKGEIPQHNLAMNFLLGFPLEVRGRKPSSDLVDKYMLKGYQYFQTFQPFCYNLISVEEKISFKVDGREFVGYVDFIGEDDSGICIVDHKSRDLKKRSGRSKPTKKDEELDEFLKQLYLYSIGVKERYGEYPSKLCFNCFKSGEFIEEPFDINALHEARQWATQEIERIRRTDEFRPSIDWFYCSNLCGFKKECCYFNDFGKPIA